MINVLPLLFLSTLSWTIEADKAPLVDPSMIRNLMSEPVVIMVTDFDEYSSQTFSLRMIEAIQSKEPIIPIVIDSYGGSVYALLHMIDAILVAPVPVATICIGKCMSAGALLLAAGTDGHRYAAPNSTILIHDISSWAAGKLPVIKVEVKEMERLSVLLFTFLAKQSHKPSNYFLNMLDSRGHMDLFFSAQEAKELGIINHVKLPSIKIKLKTEMILE